MSEQLSLHLPPPETAIAAAPSAASSAPIDFQFQQPVTLISDPAFRGHYEGREPRGGRVLVTITEPGATGKSGIKFFKAADVVAVASVMVGGVAVVRRVKDGRK